MGEQYMGAMTPDLDLSGIHEGDLFFNFNDLRRAMGLDTSNRARKDKILNELYRFVDFTQVGTGYKINHIRQVPFHKKAPKQYQELIQVLLHAYLASTPSLTVETTYKQLFYDIAMAGQNYPLIYNEEAYELMQRDLEGIDIPKGIFEEFRRVSNWGLKDKVRSALKYMNEQQLVLWQENLWICHDKFYEGGIEKGESRYTHLEASDSETSIYLNARRAMLSEFNAKTIKDIHKKNKAREYKDKVDKYLSDNYGWKYAYYKLKIRYNYEDMKVSLEDAKMALLEEAQANNIEVKKEVLNNKIQNMIEKRGQSISNCAVKKLNTYNEDTWGIRPKTLAKYDTMANENAVIAWKVLTGYFISRDTDVSALSAFAPKSDYDDIDNIDLV